jgi:hypothetical protein
MENSECEKKTGYESELPANFAAQATTLLGCLSAFLRYLAYGLPIIPVAHNGASGLLATRLG